MIFKIRLQWKNLGALLLALILIALTASYFLNQELNWENKLQGALEVHLQSHDQISGKLQTLHLTARQSGKFLKQVKVNGTSWSQLLSDAIAQLDSSGYNEITLCFGYNYKSVKTPLSHPGKLKAAKGVYGLQMKWHEDEYNVCGLQSLATNRSAWNQLRELSSDWGVPFKELNSKKLDLQIYKTKQFFVKLEPFELIQLYRGKPLVEMDQVSRKSIQEFSLRLASWLIVNTNVTTGKMNYKYWPSSGEYSTSNNMIRQFMASYALQMWAQRQSDPDLKELANKNLGYNLNQFFKRNDRVGYIEYRNKRKLGASALAALSILESDSKQLHHIQWSWLNKGIQAQWQKSGELRTFIEQDRNDLHNFYPGEALFYWSHWLTKEMDKNLLRQFMKSAQYYMNWHRANLNPAFVPWHTQAYYKVWKLQPNDFLKDAIFEMNDWLVENMQRLEAQQGYAFADFTGRFYYPKGGFGPPHASSTGVYLEGLIDAFDLARQLGDTTRAENYRKSILMGLRHALQLEFKTDADMYYISNRKMVRGGLRSRVYDNEIRVDNIQHNLLAIFKILDRFQEEDFKL